MQMPQQLAFLETLLASTGSNLQCVKLNVLDEHIADVLLHAKKMHRKLSSGEVEYLPEVSKVSEQ